MTIRRFRVLRNQRATWSICCVLLFGLASSRGQEDEGWCDAGDDCCIVPPCTCGTYVNCQSNDCFTASCEPCPEGYYCTCSAACTGLGGGGFEKIQSCPAGFFCPPLSGRPRPCPAGTFLPDTNAVREGQCQACRSFWQQSGEGAAACSISTMAIIVICAAIGAILLCCGLGVLWRRRSKRKQAEDDFHGGGAMGMANGYFNTTAYGAEIPDSGHYGDADKPQEDGGKPKRLTAEEKRAQLADRMLELEDEESAMINTVQVKRLAKKNVATGAAEEPQPAAKAPSKRKPKPEAPPDDDVEVMV